MKIKTVKFILYSIAFALGALLSYLNKNGMQQKSSSKAVTHYYIYKGKSKEELNFKEYEKGLFLSDSTVLKHKEGILASPKIAGEVAFAILEDVYSYNEAKFNYPYYISKNVYTWSIAGSCIYSRKKDVMLLGGGLSIYLNRSNGMVVSIYATK